MNLQERAVKWHARRFPEAERAHVALKTASEAGEVADAVLAQDGMSSATGNPGDGILGEAADVVITLLVLTGRYDDTGDLLAAVDAKLAILETPGACKASVR